VHGKTIRIFLADGEPTGIFLAEISYWTGKVLVAPRSQLDQLSKREEVRRTGVYLLVGPDPDDPSRALAYIGEGDNVLRRLLRRSWSEAKDIWERAVVRPPRCMRRKPCRRDRDPSASVLLGYWVGWVPRGWRATQS
jgi:hypothetical protein